MASKGEAELEFHLKAFKLPHEREFVFHPTRQWRFDFAFPSVKLAVEVEGLLWGGKTSRHQHAKGYTKDLEKYNEATILGWRILRVSPSQVHKGQAIQWIQAALKNDQ